MYDVVRHRRWFIVLVLLAIALPGYSDNVTVSGNVTFASLDGSSLDHDGAANGTFTVDDGDLTVLGSINCNDDSTRDACDMNFAVSGNLTVAAGGGLFAENRRGNGVGADISAAVGGNLVVSGTISSGNVGVDRGGDIALTVGGSALANAGSVISAASKGGQAGAITVQSGGAMDLRGLIASGPSSTLAATKYTSAILTGGSSNSAGGSITLRSTTHTEPAISVSSDATIVSEGDNAGSGTVILEGCGVVVKGLVASVSQAGVGAKVTIRTGTSATVDGSDLGSAGTRLGMLRADSLNQGAGTYSANIFARNAVTILGPASGSLYVLNSSGGKTAKDPSGTINVISTAGGVTASGNVAAATGSNNGDQGGTVNVSARDNVVLFSANINASGDFISTDSSREGGAINVRSYSGSAAWQNGTGDVRPVGSAAGVPVSQQGTISITYCTTVSTAGTSFPTNGSPVGTFPTVTQTCSPAAPTLPSGESHPDCNDPPIAVNDPYTVAEGGTLNVAAPGVLGNDVDPDGDPITAILVSGPAHASSFTFNANGSFNYVHDGSETTTDSFTYKANDGSLDSNVATVAITITPVNDPPVANDDNYPVAEGGTLNVAAPGVLSNDTDPDGPTAAAILVSGPAHASSFALNANGSFTYVHDGSETTSDSFTYRVSDGSLLSNIATVSIAVSAVNDAPVAVNDGGYVVAEGGTLNGSSVLANDTDAENNTLTAVLVSGPANASSFTLNANGTFTYVHNGSETTSDSFTYQASDGSALSNVATVSITITAVNDAPVAVNDSGYTVAEGGTLNGSSVLANDTDAENDTLTAVLVSGPANASSFTLNADGTFTYVHNGGETTSDSFTYRASDGSASSNVATVSITITPVNDAPVAVNDGPYNVNEGGTLNGSSVLANDTDADNPSLTAVLVSGPANASSFTLNANGTFTYVHNGSETTSDSFTYKANDGSLDSNVATVSITITPVNDAPVANNDGPYTVAEGGTFTLAAPGVLANDTDADGPGFVAVLVTGPAHASSFALNPDGSFTYVHNGSETLSDSFTYRANDGTSNSNIATVSITITPVNDAPVANNDSYSGTFGGTLNVPAPGVLVNDTDVDSPSLTAILVTGPANATSFTLNPDGSFSYQHNGLTPGMDSFTYKANDGSLDSNVATVLINVVSQAPVANNDSYTDVGNTQLRVGTGTGTSPARSISGSVLDNDTDADTPHILLTASAPATSTQGGSVSMNPNGSFNYLPPVGFVGSDTFTYTVSDGLNSSNGTVTINLNGRIWYVKNDTAGGDGRSTLPFNALSSAQTAAAFGDVIFVHFGNGTTTGQNGGIVLQGNQALIGEGVALTFGADTLWPAGSSPTIGNTSGDVVTLDNGNAVHGVILSASAAGIRGNSVSGGSFKKVTVNGGTDAISLSNTGGVFSMSDINLNPSFGSGLLVSGGSAVVQIADFHATTTTVGGSAVKINAGGQFVNLAGPVTNTLSSTNNAAVDITGSPSILLGVSFVSINASNGPTGIQMSNTTGAFNVLGDGTLNANGSGGSISNVTVRPVHLLGAAGSVSLSSMNMSLSASAASGMLVDNLAGGAALTVNVRGCAISGANAPAQVKALLQLEGGATANVTANVQGSFFNNSRNYGVFADAAGTSIMNVTVNQSGFGTNVVTTGAVNNPGTVITSPNVIGMAVTNSAGAQVDYAVTNNTFWGANGVAGAIYAVAFSGSSTTATSHLSGSFTGNKIGMTGVLGSGCSNGCSGVGLLPGTNGTFSATVLNNDIRQVGSRGVDYVTTAGAVGSNVIKIKGNTIAEADPAGLFRRAISVTAGNSGGASANVCAEIGGSAAADKNTISGAWQAGQFIRVTTASTTGTLTLPGLTPVTGATTAQINAFLAGNNTGVTGNVSSIIGGPINGGSPCP